MVSSPCRRMARTLSRPRLYVNMFPGRNTNLMHTKSKLRLVFIAMALATIVILCSCQPLEVPGEQQASNLIASDPTPAPVLERHPEQKPQLIPLTGDIAGPEAEISGLAWFGDVLVLLPQYPRLFNHSLFGIRRAALAEAISNPSGSALEPFPIPLLNGEELGHLDGYEGLEAIVFSDSRFYVAVEGRSRGSMLAYLIPGTVVGEAEELQLDVASAISLPPQTNLMNKAYETLLLHGTDIIAIHELSGRDLNPDRHALRLTAELEPLADMDMPEVEFRITDATALDHQGRFWVANFHWPGEKQLPAQYDGIRQRWGKAPVIRPWNS